MKLRRLPRFVLALAALILFVPAPLMLAYRLALHHSSSRIEDLGPSVSLLGRQMTLGELVKRVFFTENQNTGKAYVEQLPPPTLGAWLDGTWQRSFEGWFEPRLALREPLVRASNQLYYSLFSKSYMYNGYVVIGREQEFYELCYAQDACNTYPPPEPAADASFLANLAELSRRWRSRGKAFAVMVVPHKGEMVPSRVPERFCDNPGRSQRRLYLISALREAGVSVLDPEPGILEMAQTTGLPAYPRGGTHWSEVGAYAGALLLKEELARQFGHPLDAKPPARFGLHPRPFGSDADLVSLANLAFPPLDYPSPQLTFTKEPNEPPLSSRRLVIVGDSFTYTLADVLEQQRVFSRMSHYFYYYLGRYDYPGRRRVEVDRERVDWDEEFFSADALVMIGNAVTFMAPQNVEFLDDALEQTRVHDASAQF